MAEFCTDCAKDLCFTPENGIDFDYAGLITEEQFKQGLGMPVLCESCGPTMVDHEGNCLGHCDDKKHQERHTKLLEERNKNGLVS